MPTCLQKDSFIKKIFFNILQIKGSKQDPSKADFLPHFSSQKWNDATCLETVSKPYVSNDRSQSYDRELQRQRCKILQLHE
jgi:hypothetical protein